jgi:hypothetical protein
VAARGATRHRDWRRVRRESSRPKLASSPSLPFCNGDLQNQTKTQHRQSILVVFFSLFFFKNRFSGSSRFFKSVPFPCLLCRSVVFFFFRWQIRRGGPSVVGEEAAPLLWERDAAARLAEFAAGGRSAG